MSVELAVAIKSNKHLEKLWMLDCNLKSSATVILQSLTTISSLQVLDVNDNQVTEEAGNALASVILHNTRLEELYLRDNNLDKGMLETAKALQHITSLKSLDLSNNNISNEVSVELAVAFKSNKHLEELWTFDCSLKSSATVILQPLTTISTLKCLNINDNQLSEEVGEALASVILHNTGLEELYLYGNDFGNGILQFVTALQNILLLKVLSLGNNNITKITFDELALVIKSNKHLEKLWLSNSNLQSSAIDILQSLSTISTLKLLNINDNQITEEAGEALASVVLHNTKLKELHLSSNSFGEGLLTITKALKHITSLTSLDFGNNNISKEAADELALAIRSNKHLTELHMYNCNLKSSAVVILQSLSNVSTIKLLNVNDNQMPPQAAKTLASVIMCNTRLEKLYLRDSNLSEGILEVAKALQHITSLKSLDLSKNNISNEVSVELAVAIKSNKHLEELWMLDCNLRSSATVILQSLSTISSLKFLNVSDNQVTEEAGEALASVILHNTGLKELYLRNNNLGKGMLEIVKALQHITSLKSLNLGNNNISSEVSVELAIAFQLNKHLKELWMFDCNLKSSATVILQSLTTISSLKCLNINHNQVNEEAGEALASVILCNTGMEELHLRNNTIARGLLNVAKALQHVTSLKSIDIGNNNIPKEVSSELALVVESNKHLENLCLHNNNLKSSAFTILQSLSTISTLKLLDLNNNQLSEESGEALTSVVLHSTELEELYLYGNDLGKGILQVVKALQHNSLLKVLNLGSNDISILALDQLALAIKSNRQLEKLYLYNTNLHLSATVFLQSLSTVSALKVLNMGKIILVIIVVKY